MNHERVLITGGSSVQFLAVTLTPSDLVFV